MVQQNKTQFILPLEEKGTGSFLAAFFCAAAESDFSAQFAVTRTDTQSEARCALNFDFSLRAHTHVTVTSVIGCHFRSLGHSLDYFLFVPPSRRQEQQNNTPAAISLLWEHFTVRFSLASGNNLLILFAGGHQANGASSKLNIHGIFPEGVEHSRRGAND